MNAAAQTFIADLLSDCRETVRDSFAKHESKIVDGDSLSRAIRSMTTQLASVFVVKLGMSKDAGVRAAFGIVCEVARDLGHQVNIAG